MAWNTPLTFVSGAKHTAAALNAGIRDNFKALGDPWTAYTPTWSATGTPTVGNGSLTGAYILTGKRVEFRIRLLAGPTTTYGTGAWSFTPPATLVGYNWRFDGLAFDNSVNNYRPVTGIAVGGTSIALYCDSLTAGGTLRTVTSTVPFTWAADDILFISGSAEVA